MINKLNRYSLSIKIKGFYELGKHISSIPIFSRNDVCYGIDDLMIQLESCKEQLYLKNKLINKNDKSEVLDIIDFYPYYIEIQREGIYRITQSRGNSKQIFEGKFQFVSYDNDENSEVFIIMRNESIYSGSFKEIMRQLSPFRYTGSYDCFKKIFNHYTREFVEEK